MALKMTYGTGFIWWLSTKDGRGYLIPWSPSRPGYGLCLYNPASGAIFAKKLLGIGSILHGWPLCVCKVFIRGMLEEEEKFINRAS
jgi:hypothetical protein